VKSGGVRDPGRFARMAEDPDVMEQIELLPLPIRKPIRLMLERIRKDRSGD